MTVTMIRTLSALAIVAAIAVPVAPASAAEAPGIDTPSQQFDLGSDVSGYRRFLIYPHLQKAAEALQRGDRERALLELERARSLAPGNAAIALRLAQAYQAFGENVRAAAVLRDQISRTPGDTRVRAALASVLAPAKTPVQPPQPQPVTPASAPVSDTMLASVRPPSAARPLTARTRRPAVEATALDPVNAAADPLAPFTRALQDHRFVDVEAEANGLLAQRPDEASLLDELTYRMSEAGATAPAVRVLLNAYPFTAADMAGRDLLLNRLVLLLQREPDAVIGESLARLRTPLDAPGLRSRQGVLWASRHDCDAVRAVLSDASPEYTHDDWIRLGDCLTAGGPAAAIPAYARAHALTPGGAGSRGLAYQAYAIGDYPTAMVAWRSIGERLTGEDLLAASTTALSAGDNVQAGLWIDQYRAGGAPLSHQYWQLVARFSLTQGDRLTAASALEHAVSLQPAVDDYLQLAQLQDDPRSQIRWLEQAVELDPDREQAQAALGYAFDRAGDRSGAKRAFERAAMLDADDASVQLTLGYIYWEAGDAVKAAGALEHAAAAPGNIAAAQQLVYVYQRLHKNEASRAFAERVLDAFTTTGGNPGPLTNEQLERQFGLQRLHEDLGRRITVNLDGFSGTSVGTGSSAAGPGSRYSSYSQLEGEYRLGREPVRNGTTFAAYGRLLADGGTERLALPSQNRTLGVGARWKPWRSQVLYLAAEGQTSLQGSTRRDLLLRSSASFLNGGRSSDDWHASGQGWFARNLYLDAAHYVKSAQSAFTADLRQSYHLKIAGRQSLEPYVHLQASGIRTRDIARDERVGVGARWNLWHGASQYNAPAHKISLGVEFQQALETYLTDRRGIFLSLGSHW